MKDRKIMTKNPIIWFKYALLVGVVFLAHWVSGVIGLEQYVMTNKWLGWTLLFIFYYVFIALGDRALEYILNVD
jgi:ABC-type transport system involved in multi-copper enzyme maturation permease subunit